MAKLIDFSISHCEKTGATCIYVWQDDHLAMTAVMLHINIDLYVGLYR